MVGFYRSISTEKDEDCEGGRQNQKAKTATMKMVGGWNRKARRRREMKEMALATGNEILMIAPRENDVV